MVNTYPTWCQLKSCNAKLAPEDRLLPLKKMHLFRGSIIEKEIEMYFCPEHREMLLEAKLWSPVS